MPFKLGFGSQSGSAVTAKIFKALVTVGGLTLIVRSLEAATHLMAAALFGAGDAMDALVIALLAPVFCVNIISGAFHTSFIPAYIRQIKKNGDSSANRFLRSALTLILLLAGFLALLLYLGASYILPLLGSGFSSAKLQLTRTLFDMALPLLLFGVLARVWAAVLNADEKFKLAAASPAIRSLILIGVLTLMAPYLGIYAFAWGLVGGALMETAVLAVGVRRQNLPVRPGWSGMTAPLRQVIRQFAPMTAGSLLMAGTELIDHAMAAMLEPGSVATLSYANKIIMFILVVGSGALGTAVFPYFSQMAAYRDRKEITATLKTYARWIILLSAPATAVLCLGAQPLVRLLFERGAFTPQDTLQTAAVVRIYAFQITFYLLSILEVRLISALRGNHILMASAMISLPLNILFNYIFMHFMGVAGIALSTVLVYLAALAFLTVMLRKMIIRLDQ